MDVHPGIDCLCTNLFVQFDRFDQVHGKIAELDFSRLILSYASMNDQRRKKFFKRVKKKYGNSICASHVEQVKGGLFTGDNVW